LNERFPPRETNGAERAGRRSKDIHEVKDNEVEEATAAAQETLGAWVP
jgi:hypothetical protein